MSSGSSASCSIDELVRAVLYEGYALYPYRPSALKNTKRFAFGVVYPRAWAEHALEAAVLRVEIIARAEIGAQVTTRVKYLELSRAGSAREHTSDAPVHALGGPPQAAVLATPPLAVGLEVSSVAVGLRLWRVTIELRNEATLARDADRDAALDVSPASSHVIVQIAGGELVSSIDPPADAASVVAGCRCTGLYPVLVGNDTVLASPIILPDFPELAPQSPGDFFDGTEIDEMLVLRILTMTEGEKAEASAADPRIAALIERTERNGIADTMRLHGVARTTWPRTGTRVRVRPRRSADAFDALLAGKLATVTAVERDLEGAVHCAVTIDDDPGADLGAAGLPGHRFFFHPDELEVIA